MSGADATLGSARSVGTAGMTGAFSALAPAKVERSFQRGFQQQSLPPATVRADIPDPIAVTLLPPREDYMEDDYDVRIYTDTIRSPFFPKNLLHFLTDFTKFQD